MARNEGDTLPQGTLLQMTQDGPAAVDMAQYATGRVAIFALPGAYTGICSTQHVPSFIRTADQFRAKGVDRIVCVSVNDPFVMGAWAKDTGAEAAGLTFLSDADGAFTEAMGMSFDAPPAGLFGRSADLGRCRGSAVAGLRTFPAGPSLAGGRPRAGGGNLSRGRRQDR